MPDRPNILWLMTDEQRTDSLGCYGSPWAVSPAIDRLAAGGSRFTAAVTPAPVCMPARTTILTGRYPHDTGIWWNTPSLLNLEHLTSRFVDEGYVTANFGKQHYGSTVPAFQTVAYAGLDGPVGFVKYADGYDESAYDVVKYSGPYEWILAGRYPEDPSTTSEARCVARAKEWLTELPGDTPFLVRVSFNGPHTPVVPPAPFDHAVAPDAIRLPPETESMPDGAPAWIHRLREIASSDCLSASDVVQIREAYYGEVAYLDTLFDDLLTWMAERNLLDDTYIVFVTDHGTHLGDFGLVQKCTFYEPVVTVPYFFSGPGIAAQVVGTPVETRSLLPTLMELAGLDLPDHVADASLATVLRGESAAPERPVFSEFTLGTLGISPDERLVMVRSGDWKLSLRLAPEPTDRVLTDLASDPNERKNLVEAEPDVAADLESLIRHHLAGAG